MSTVLLDAAGRRRSPATMPGFHSGRPPRNNVRRYPADPPKVEEIVAVMRQAGTTPHGLRMRGLIVVLWRAGLRIHESLALTEADLDARRGSVLVRRGKGGRRREVGMERLGLGTASAGAGGPRRPARHEALGLAHLMWPSRSPPGTLRARQQASGATLPSLSLFAIGRFSVPQQQDRGDPEGELVRPGSARRRALRCSARPDRGVPR